VKFVQKNILAILLMELLVKNVYVLFFNLKFLLIFRIVTTILI